MTALYVFSFWSEKQGLLFRDVERCEGAEAARARAERLQAESAEAATRVDVAPAEDFRHPWGLDPIGFPPLGQDDDPHAALAEGAMLTCGFEQPAAARRLVLCATLREETKPGDGGGAEHPAVELRMAGFEESVDGTRVLVVPLLARIRGELVETWLDPAAAPLQQLAVADRLPLHLYQLAGRPVEALDIANSVRPVAASLLPQVGALPPASPAGFEQARLAVARRFIRPWGLWLALAGR